MDNSHQIIVDGSGHGGQVVRNTISQSFLKFLDGYSSWDKESIGWKGSVKIINIRDARPNSGMKNSLFGIVNFVESFLDNFVLNGLVDGSMDLELDYSNAQLKKEISDIINVDANRCGSSW